MKILQRYVFRELLLPFALCLIVLNFIFMGGYLVKAAHFIIGRGVPFLDTVYIILLAMPEMIGYTVPTSILMAVLIVFGNLSQHNELRAMKASGVHLVQVVIPVFLVGMILSFGMFIFNDQVMGNASFELRRTMKKMLIRFPKALIEPGRFVKLSDSIIFLAKRVRGDDLIDVIAYEIENADQPVRTIIAESGKIISEENSGKVRIQLYNGSISDAESKGVHTIQFRTYEFPTLGQEDVRNMNKKKRELSLAEMLVQLADSQMSKDDRRELWTSYHHRIAFACGSFIFVFIGIPIAILVRRGEIVLSFGIAMASASFYYVLFAGARTLAIQGIVTPMISLWIPNVMLLIAGYYLLKRSVTT
ncbi:MAG: LptF/LptG family permease [Candidatus Omnitrophica bacterium]|nr:LptF/LptG family permease [Candidatus Omnitrophota bacterium]MDD5672480.1 LptF/LptG family permease [Candidatus Omnitrophota bacterium]